MDTLLEVNHFDLSTKNKELVAEKRSDVIK